MAWNLLDCGNRTKSKLQRWLLLPASKDNACIWASCLVKALTSHSPSWLTDTFSEDLKDSHNDFVFTSAITSHQCPTYASPTPPSPHGSHSEVTTQPSRLSKGFCYWETLKGSLLYHSHSALPSRLSLFAPKKPKKYSE